MRSGTGYHRDDLPSRAAAGEARLVVAMASETCDPAAVEDFRLARTAAGPLVHGGSPFALDARRAPTACSPSPGSRTAPGRWSCWTPPRAACRSSGGR